MSNMLQIIENPHSGSHLGHHLLYSGVKIKLLSDMFMPNVFVGENYTVLFILGKFYNNTNTLIMW